jgi:outer membrane receptor for ferrienterochelin and colicins
LRFATIPIFLCLINFLSADAQEVDKKFKGKVILFANNETDEESDSKPAIGANIYWLGTKVSTTSNPLGKFELERVPNANKLVVSYINYIRDTILVADTASYAVIRIRPTEKKIKGVVISGKKASTEISYLSTSQVLKIGKGELLKAACCNLSESFETTPSVDVSYTDAITGQKQIQLLGLATPHTLFTQENIPNLRGLASIIGLNFTPGSWVSDMQLSKGAGSVVNGYEGVAGQINVELVKPTFAEKLHVNLYQSISGRSEANVVANKKWNEQLASGVMVHYKNQWYKQDHNDDSFVDNPLGKQIAALYRMQYFSKNGFEIQGIYKFTNSAEQGGQLKSGLPFAPWKYENNLTRNEMSLKIGKAYVAKPWKSMGLQLSYIAHNQNTNAGTRKYTGLQNSAYANYIFQSVIGNTNHQYKIGTSIAADNFNETIPSSTIPLLRLNREELVGGVFAEHTYNYLDKLTIVSGIRADKHNLFGLFFTPRIHLRYQLLKQTTLRLNAGRAQRTASIMAENMQALFSNRKLIFQGDSATWQKGLQPEVSYNFGASVVQAFKLNYRKGTIMVDAYYSTFKKQWIADFETPYEVNFYSLNGNSFAKSFQIQTDYEIVRKKLDLRMAYRYYDIQTKYRNTTWLSKPLVSRHRAFVNVGYSSPSKWKLDATAVWNGVKRLSNFYADHTIHTLHHEVSSPNFITINAHVSKQINKNLELYAGGENLTNYSQHQPIISSVNTTANDFDATQVWGPIMGINAYAGLRYTLK